MVEVAGGDGRGEREPVAADLQRRGGRSVVRSEVDEVTSALCVLAGQIHAANAELVGLLARLDAVGGWQHRDGQPLDLGRSQRLVSRAQRRALRFRDGPGCAFPGCAARHVDAHHLQHWSDGGPTDLDNLILLCRHHHRLLHEGGYTARLEGRHPRFYRPNGTPIRPPNPPPHHRRYRATGRNITAHTARARSGGAPHWSPQYALDALVSRR